MKNHNMGSVPAQLIGRSLSTTESCERAITAAPAPRQVWQEIDSLGQIISEIHAAVDNLEKRLQPILSSVPSPVLDGEKKECSPCDLAISLSDKIRVLRVIDIRLRALERDVQV